MMFTKAHDGGFKTPLEGIRLKALAWGDRFEAAPGDAWAIPPDVEHEAEVLEKAVVIETFSPLREDYLPEA